jgi:actin-like ATPase involved in cell morphogenesis
LRYFLGVDLGTTYSAAAITVDGSTEIFPLGSRVPSMPSVVFLKEDGVLLVGEAAERRAVGEPYRTAGEFKRRLGDPIPILLGGTPYGADALTGALLRGIVAEVTERQGRSPSLVAVTHPANYGPYKLGLLEEATRLADVEDVVFLTEPEAAALHYWQSQRIGHGSIVAVYDFGGGTFDAAILQRATEGFTILGAPEGMERFGGVDLDDAVFGYVRDALGDALEDVDDGDPVVAASLAKLRDECRVAKEALSEDTDTTIQVMLPSVHTQVRLTRAEFEDLIRPRLRDTLSSLERATRSAGIGWDDLDRVLLVGGSSRIPLVGEMVRAATGKPVALDAHPKHTVALGAAQFARRAMPAAGDSPSPTSPPRERVHELPADITPAPSPGPTRSVPYRVGLAAVVAMVVAVGAFLVLRVDGSDGREATTPSTATADGISTSVATTVPITAATTVPTTVATTVPITAATTVPTTAVFEVFQPVAGSPMSPPGPMPGSEGAAGSGCETDGDQALGSNNFIQLAGDGVWFGYVSSRWEDEGVFGIEFDPACFYFGDAAYEEGAADGVSVDNDFYVRNTSPVSGEIEIRPTTDVHSIRGSEGAEFLVVAFAYWPALGGGFPPCRAEDQESDGAALVDVLGDFCGVWLYVNDGIVTDMVEQFVP